MKTIEERIKEVRAYLKERGYVTFLRERFMGQYRLDIMRHEDDFWKSEEYKHCQELLGDNYYEGSYGSDIYSLYIKVKL